MAGATDYAEIDWANVAPIISAPPWWTDTPAASPVNLSKPAMMVLAGGAALALLIVLLPTGNR